MVSDKSVFYRNAPIVEFWADTNGRNSWDLFSLFVYFVFVVIYTAFVPQTKKSSLCKITELFYSLSALKQKFMKLPL